MKRSIREAFLLWIGRKAGVGEYEVMPTWLRVVAYIIMPERLQWAWEMRGYNPMTDVYTFRGVKVSSRLLVMLTKPTPEGVWFRSAKVEGGIVTMEMRIFHDEQAENAIGCATTQGDTRNAR
jgi:hypothetical protein